ncbi:4Fe-4S binding protein [Anaeromicropila herbilytica]|uniref:(Fe-S)-binding protein n=1 Tax=Anaeromicropila herbilytica TaxID=2785025 RepID=A0A7R7EIV8_9FIRM|nr:4Fe-4S binding protein [Anaeromicropila herbilytica]BCN29578.1 (Fe-S)-binding protein [Anaeromicropila herbilytica]
MRKLLNWWKKYSYIVMIIIMLIGLIYPKIMLIFIICMLGPSLTGVFTRRYWCGNICPIGNFFDHVTIKISNYKKAPKFLKSKIIRILFTILMMSMFVFEMINAFGNPIMTGMIFYEMILEAIIIGTFLTVIYHHRTWCHFCPMGSTGAVVTYLSSNKNFVLHVTNKCNSCKQCERKCPMGLSPYEYRGKRLSSYDCIQCGSCKAKCHTNAICYNNNSTAKAKEVFAIKEKSE